MPIEGYYLEENGRVKVQFEDIAGGANPPTGWVWQGAGAGNNPGFQGSGYYYWKSETNLGLDRFPTQGLITATVYIQEAGTYSLRVRSARDSNDPPDQRNDVWVKIDGDSRAALPSDYPAMVTSNGFVKLYGATANWGFAQKFDSVHETDPNPPAQLVLSQGFHTITFAGRSQGFHMDFFELYRDQNPDQAGIQAPAVNAPNSTYVLGDTPPGGEEPEPVPGVPVTVTVAVAAGSDDWERFGGGVSDDLEMGVKAGKANVVALRFAGIDIPEGAAITGAYLEFEADATSAGAAAFTIAIEDALAAATYGLGSEPGTRAYRAETVTWDVESWAAGGTYRSVDISALIQALLGSGGVEAGALGFRITGTGLREAESFEAPGAEPRLVLTYAIPKPEPVPGLVTAAIATSTNDWEQYGSPASTNLEFGFDGSRPQYVGLRFTGMELSETAEIESAYFVFEAFSSNAAWANFTIAIENTIASAAYSTGNNPGNRTYLAEQVSWKAGTWEAGGSYQSADISSLIEAVIADGGLDALDALAFRITGSGSRVAHSFDSDGAAPRLVINYEDQA